MNRQLQVDPSHSDFTIGFLLDQLGPDRLAGGAVKRAEAKPLNTGGFVSDLYRFRIQFADGKPEFSCIFKIPTTRKLDSQVKYDDETYKELVKWTFQVHNAECRFYSEVAPLLAGAPLPLPFRLPQLYVSRPCPAEDCVSGGFLLMEDLCAQKAVAQVELTEGLSKEQVESAVCALAHYHALCLWLPTGLIESFALKTNLDFEEDKLHVVERLMAMPDGKKAFGPMESELLDLFLQSGFLQPNNQHRQFGLAPVLVHGDFWSNNLFFEAEAGSETAGNNLDSIFDWQVVYSGTGVNDLIRVIFVCVDAHIRRANIHHWLRLYAEQLNSTLDKLGISGVDGEGGSRHRPLQMVRQLAEFHARYELCFQLFLCTNVLGGLKETEKRRKLLDRMRELFEDCRLGCPFGGEQ